MYDVIVVGGGAAGLSAALILGRCRRSVLIIDAGKPRNAAAEAMHGYLTRDGLSPLELTRLGREEVAAYGVEIRDGEVVTACRNADATFGVTLADGSVFVARRLLIATGVRDMLPAIDGLLELYGRSVFHCPYCDGWEVRDRALAVYGRGRNAFGLALGLTTWSRNVVILSDGSSGFKRSDRERLRSNGIEVREQKVRRLEGEEGGLRRIVFADGTTLDRDAMFFSTGQRQVSDLAIQLGCRFNGKGTVITDRSEQSSAPGVYVVGDASHDVQFVIVAAAEGARAAVAINHSFQQEETAGTI